MSLLAIMETDVHAIRIRPAQGFAATRPWGARAWERAGVWGDWVRTPCWELTRGVWSIFWAARSLGLKTAWNVAKGSLWSGRAVCPASVESGPRRTYLCASHFSSLPLRPGVAGVPSNSQGLTLFWPMACWGSNPVDEVWQPQTSLGPTVLTLMASPAWQMDGRKGWSRPWQPQEPLQCLQKLCDKRRRGDGCTN